MIIRISSLLALMALPLAAQEQKAPPVDYSFYRAYYLERAERRSDEAIQHYQKFLAAAPSHRFAGRAAANMVNLLYRVGKTAEAEKAEQKFAAVLKTVDRNRTARGGRGGRGGERGGRGGMGRGGERGGRGGERGGRGGMGRGGRGGEQGGGAENDARRAAFIKRMEEAIAQAKEDGDEDRVKRLTERLAQYKSGGAGAGRGGNEGGRGGMGRGGRGGQGRGGRGGQGRGGRRGFGMGSLADAENDEARTQTIDRIQQFADRMIGFMEDRGQDDRAKSIQTNLDKFNALVKEKKWKEADGVVQEMMGGMRGGRGNRGGGNRGGGNRGGGNRGGRGGNRGGGGLQISREDLRPPLVQMNDEKRQEKVKFLVDYAARQVETMKTSGREEQAAGLKKQMDAFKKLVEEKKWAEADKVVEQVQRQMGGGNRRRGAGGTEGRRRRGGGGGGEIK